MKVHKSSQRGSFLGKDNAKPTKIEQEILHYLSNEFLTVKQIAIRRQCSTSNIYKIIRKLKKKGLLNPTNQMVHKIQPTLSKKLNQIRLHGQEFNIKILYKDQRYKKLLKKSNLINIDGNTIRLYSNSIEVYSGMSFYADDPQKATSNSFKYWNKLFTRLEHQLKIIIVKPRYQNIRLVNSHYAEINNELSEECERKGYKLRIYTKDDGKLWFVIDNSFNLHEAETLHPKTAKKDMEKIQPYFNDLRDDSHYLPSEVKRILLPTLKLVQEIAEAQLNQTKIIETLLPKKITTKSIKKERMDYVG